ncbi:MAG TPA: type IV pilus modification protein PilV [Steroidobacteraceae bacterium]|nr:type IV pilus modification protein PilV [Steroidobacteraceae bacterium]
MSRQADDRSSVRRRAGGFTLIEVLVALLVIAVGMLGVAKLQGLALSNTGVARMRSLAALQATSLAAAMHANRSFWASQLGTVFTNTYNSATQTNTPGGTVVMAGGEVCEAPTVCSAPQVAGYDVYKWVFSLNANLPNASETVQCTSGAPGPNACTITIDWTEQIVNSSQQQVQPVAGAATIARPTYILNVVP